MVHKVQVYDTVEWGGKISNIINLNNGNIYVLAFIITIVAYRFIKYNINYILLINNSKNIVGLLLSSLYKYYCSKTNQFTF